MTRPFESLSAAWLRRASQRAAAEVSSRSPASEDDVALGCESADPALQIERWHTDGHSERPHAG